MRATALAVVDQNLGSIRTDREGRRIAGDTIGLPVCYSLFCLVFIFFFIFQTVSLHNVYKGSAWVPAYAGTHTTGRAGRHFELFDSILGRVKKVTTRHHGLRVQYVR